LASRKLVVGSAKLIDDILLFEGELVAFGPFASAPNNFRNILDTMDNPLDLTVKIQNGSIQRAPISFFKAAIRASLLSS
jgi:hypothetical protein